MDWRDRGTAQGGLGELAPCRQQWGCLCFLLLPGLCRQALPGVRGGERGRWCVIRKPLGPELQGSLEWPVWSRCPRPDITRGGGRLLAHAAVLKGWQALSCLGSALPCSLPPSVHTWKGAGRQSLESGGPARKGPWAAGLGIRRAWFGGNLR